MTTKRVFRSNDTGFTLIEILIVIVIIGITVGFALITFGDFGESRRILFSAEQLAHTLSMAQQQAILETSTLGLRIDNSSYQILKYHNSSQWQPISNKGIFKIYYFPKNTVITLKTNPPPVQGRPAIVISSSGDMTVFSLGFGNNKNNVMTTLSGRHDGTLTFTLAGSK